MSMRAAGARSGFSNSRRRNASPPLRCRQPEFPTTKLGPQISSPISQLGDAEAETTVRDDHLRAPDELAADAQIHVVARRAIRDEGDARLERDDTLEGHGRTCKLDADLQRDMLKSFGLFEFRHHCQRIRLIVC